MGDLGKLRAYVAAHPLGIALGHHQIRVLGLDVLELHQPLVELGVCDFWIIQRIVAISVVIK